MGAGVPKWNAAKDESMRTAQMAESEGEDRESCPSIAAESVLRRCHAQSWANEVH